MIKKEWTVVEYDARVIVKMSNGRHFEILLSQNERATPPTKQETVEVAMFICHAMNLMERSNNDGKISTP